MDYNQFKKGVPDSLLAAVDEAMKGTQSSPKTPSGDKEPPFDKPYAKAGPHKDRFGNPVKNVARHLARKGLAMHRVAEEAYITEGSVGYKHYTITGGQPHDLRNEVGAPEHVAADLRKLKNLGVHANEGDGEKYGHVTKVTVTNNQTGEKSHHHVYQRDMSRNQQRPVFSVRHLSKVHPEHINVLKHYIAGKTKIKDSLGLYEGLPGAYSDKETMPQSKMSKERGATARSRYVKSTGKGKGLGSLPEKSMANEEAKKHYVMTAGGEHRVVTGGPNSKIVKAFPYGDTQSKQTSSMQHAAAYAFAKKMNAGIKKPARGPRRDIAVEEGVEIDEAYPTAASLARKSKAIKQARAVATGYANQKSGKWASQSYKTDDGRWASKDVKEEAEGLDELTKKTLQSYIAKAGKDRTKQLGNERKYENRMKGSSQAVAKLAKASPDKDLEDYKNWRKTQHNDKKTTNDIITKKTPYHEEVESIDELSKGLLNRYKLGNERDRENLASGLWYPKGEAGATEKQKKDSAKLDKRMAGTYLASKKLYPSVWNPKQTGKPGAKVHATEEVVELEESVAKVRNALQARGSSVFPDSIGKNKDGHIVVRKGFYYKHGKSAEAQTAGIKRALDDAGIKHTIVKDGEHNAPFRGGASVGRQSHFYTHIKLHEDIGLDENATGSYEVTGEHTDGHLKTLSYFAKSPAHAKSQFHAKQSKKDYTVKSVKKLAEAVNPLRTPRFAEKVELDELSKGLLDRYELKNERDRERLASGLWYPKGEAGATEKQKKDSAKLDKRIAGRDLASMKTHPKVFDPKVTGRPGAKVHATEETIEELRAATIDSYRKKAYDQQPAGDDGSQLYKKRKTGRDLAFKKVTHGAKIMATEEEVKRGRGRPSKASLDIEDEPEALGMQLRKAKSINKPVTFNNKETKQIDPKHLFAFNNHMDARRTTQEKHAFQKKASASHADFVKAVSEPIPARAKDTGEIIRYGQGRY